MAAGNTSAAPSRILCMRVDLPTAGGPATHATRPVGNVDRARARMGRDPARPDACWSTHREIVTGSAPDMSRNRVRTSPNKPGIQVLLNLACVGLVSA